MSGTDQTINIDSRLVVARGWAVGEMGTGYLFKVIKLFWSYILVMVVQLSEYATKNF